MTCTEFLAQLDDLIDNQITKASIRADIDQHLKDCDHCVVTFNTTRKTVEIYRSHELYELPASLRDRLRQAIMAKCKKGC